MFSKGKVINFQNMHSYLLIANNLVGRGKRSYLLHLGKYNDIQH